MSEKTLYEIYIEGTAYVVADSEREAEDIIRRQIQDETASWNIFAREMKPQNPIEGTWGKCIPWGENEDDMTVEGWLERVRNREDAK